MELKHFLFQTSFWNKYKVWLERCSKQKKNTSSTVQGVQLTKVFMIKYMLSLKF